MSAQNTLSVAVLAEEPLGWGSGKHYFPALLQDYAWAGRGGAYRMATTYLYDRDLLAGRLTVADFDVLLVPGGGVGDGEAVTKGLTFCRRVRRWKRAIAGFIEAGGGYVGICGGAALMTGLRTGHGAPRSVLERLYDQSAIGASCVQSYYKDLSLPIFTLGQGRFPERTGATSYVFSFAPGEAADGRRLHAAGVPVDFRLAKDNPIFADCPGDSLRMRWWGGPGLVLPDRPDRQASALAFYPDPDFSRVPGTRISAWSYTGGVLGLLRGALRSVAMIVRHGLSLRDVLTYAYYLARGWRRSDRHIDLDCAGRPCITAEIYPNPQQGRIVLCAAHPEYMVWWGGRIEEADEADACLARGMRRWTGIDPLSETLQRELTHSWWLVRRMVAWAAKVPGGDMPPLGPSPLNDAARQIIEDNIRWDGTWVDHMRNI